MSLRTKWKTGKKNSLADILALLIVIPSLLVSLYSKGGILGIWCTSKPWRGTKTNALQGYLLGSISAIAHVLSAILQQVFFFTSTSAPHLVLGATAVTLIISLPKEENNKILNHCFILKSAAHDSVFLSANFGGPTSLIRSTIIGPCIWLIS